MEKLLIFINGLIFTAGGLLMIYKLKNLTSIFEDLYESKKNTFIRNHGDIESMTLAKRFKTTLFNSPSRFYYHSEKKTSSALLIMGITLTTIGIVGIYLAFD